MGRLDNRVAIVTGASRGLGKSIAELFAAEGAAVAVVARTEAQWDPRLPGTVHDTVASIEAAGGRAVAIPAEMQQYGIPVNVLMPSEPVLSPGNLYAGAGDIDYASPERFAEAELQVALADATVTTGQLLWSEEVLQPELGSRGWLPRS